MTTASTPVVGDGGVEIVDPADDRHGEVASADGIVRGDAHGDDVEAGVPRLRR